MPLILSAEGNLLSLQKNCCHYFRAAVQVNKSLFIKLQELFINFAEKFFTREIIAIAVLETKAFQTEMPSSTC